MTNYISREKKKYDSASFAVKYRVTTLLKNILRKIGLHDSIRKAADKIHWWKSHKKDFNYNWGVNVNDGVYFYQSFPSLGIKGGRQTDVRIKTYRLYDFLDKSMSVLDIGCNCGFFDMTIADHVKSVTGVEYDKDYVEFANKAAEILELDNVRFFQGDFNEWIKVHNEKYNVIFAFAIHYWLNLSADEFAQILSEIIEQDGYLVFESHAMSQKEGKGFWEYCDALKSHGFSEDYRGTIEGDENNGRVWIVFRKNNNNSPA